MFFMRAALCNTMVLAIIASILLIIAEKSSEW
jgi:hypothetical protein